MDIQSLNCSEKDVSFVLDQLITCILIRTISLYLRDMKSIRMRTAFYQFCKAEETITTTNRKKRAEGVLVAAGLEGIECVK